MTQNTLLEMRSVRQQYPGMLAIWELVLDDVQLKALKIFLIKVF